MSTQAALFYVVPPAAVLCRRCGAHLNGKLHRDGDDGPECAVPCGPRVFQLALPDPGPARLDLDRTLRVPARVPGGHHADP